MASPKVFSRLRKLLALARSPEAHEARSARAKADALMARHGVRESDADVPGPGEVAEVPLGAAGFEEAWKFKLATAAARHHGCEALGLRVGRRRKVRLVGVGAGVGRAAELFRSLDRELRGIARAEMSGVVRRLRQFAPGRVRQLSERYLRYFREGAVDGVVASLLRERRAGAPASAGEAAPGRAAVGEAPVQSAGLVRVEPREDPGVRERVASYGAREVGGEGGDEDFDELAELAYSSGFRQAASIQVSGRVRE